MMAGRKAELAHEKGNSLVLDASCKSFEQDTSFWSEAQDAQLDSVKAKIAECASFAISGDSAHRFFDCLMWNEGDEKDSVGLSARCFSKNKDIFALIV